MVRRSYVMVIALLLGVALVAGCAQRPTSEATGKVRVTVSIVPQKYFVERIGGEHVDVNVMVLPGNSPATYEPRPEQLTALSEAAWPLFTCMAAPGTCSIRIMARGLSSSN